MVRTTKGNLLQPPRGSFRDNLRAMFRRQPQMAEFSVGVENLLGELGPFVAIGTVLGAILVAVTSELSPAFVVIVMAQPFGWAHLAGVRNRWLALAAAVAVGSIVGTIVVALLPDTDWADLMGVCAGTVAASAPYALVTQIGERR